MPLPGVSFFRCSLSCSCLEAESRRRLASERFSADPETRPSPSIPLVDHFACLPFRIRETHDLNKSTKWGSCSTVYHSDKIQMSLKPQARLVMAPSTEVIARKYEFNRYRNSRERDEIYVFWARIRVIHQKLPHSSTVLRSRFVRIVILVLKRDKFDGLQLEFPEFPENVHWFFWSPYKNISKYKVQC